MEVVIPVAMYEIIYSDITLIGIISFLIVGNIDLTNTYEF